MSKNPSLILEQQQNQQLLSVYHGYRCLLALILLAIAITPYADSFRDQTDLHFYLYCIGYLVFSIVTAAFWKFKPSRSHSRVILLDITADIGLLTLMSYITGGIGNGLEMLPIVPVAAASMFFSGIIATAISALAVLSILGLNTYFALDNSDYNQRFLTAALIGAVFFATGFLVQYLAARIRSTQAYAEQVSAGAATVEKLNELIVQRLRTGIIVCDQNGLIRVSNDAAKQFMQEDTPVLPNFLMPAFQQWHQSPGSSKLNTIKLDDKGVEIKISLTPLDDSSSGDTLVFLEDTRTLAQQAQQLKLASLGRLTASIAHEIRNPLSAISHSAQLLSESDKLHEADLRLCEIIHTHTRRVNQIIENVLGLSRRQVPMPQRLDLNQWLDEFRLKLQQSYETPIAIDIHIDQVGLSAHFDPSHLEQVMINLCNNGLHFSLLTTGQHRLTIAGGIQAQSQLPYLDIIDYGPGVSEEQADKIFEPFFTTESQGTGLGLFIARELCEMNQAHLAFRRTDDGLSCFRLSFAHINKNIILDLP